MVKLILRISRYKTSRDTAPDYQSRDTAGVASRSRNRTESGETADVKYIDNS